MFKPFPTIQVAGPGDFTHYISLGYITAIQPTGKHTCVVTNYTGMVTTETPIEQVVAQVRQAGGLLIEVLDRKNQTCYLMARSIVRVEVDRKGAVTIHLEGGQSAGGRIITKTPADDVLRQLAALQ